MIGQRVESWSSVGISWVVFGLIGIALLALSLLTGGPHPAVLSLLPFALAVAAYLTGESPVAFTITEEGLAFEQPDLGFVRYSDLTGLTAPVSRKPGEYFAIQLYHSTGVVRIPSNIALSSRDLYDSLLERLPPLDTADPDWAPSSLRNFVAEQVQTFGAEKVFVYRARPFPPQRSNSRKLAYAVATICTTVAWFAIGIGLEGNKKGEGAAWMGFGCVFSFVGLLFALIFSQVRTHGRPKNWRNSCLVISPGGIAMVQGKLRGKMRWNELRAIDYPAKPRLGLASHGGARSGLGLLTEGAYLIIADIYVRPLGEIRRALQDYWGGRDAN